MTGRRPHHSNVMGTGTGQSFRVSGTDRSGLPGANWTTCPQHFRESGWLTLGGGKTFHPNDPPHFDQPFSWSADLPYYDFTCTPLNTPSPPLHHLVDHSSARSGADFLTSAASAKNPMLPATNTSYTGICPGQCAWAGKGGSCTPKGEANATGNSLAGPIAVW